MSRQAHRRRARTLASSSVLALFLLVPAAGCREPPGAGAASAVEVARQPGSNDASPGLEASPSPEAAAGPAPEASPELPAPSAAPAGPRSAEEEGLPAEAVLAEHGDRRLTVYVGGEPVARFPAVFGRRGIGKERRDDGRTPGGTYRLHRGRPSRYARFLPVGYPNAEDGRRGFEAGLVTKAQLRAIVRADERGVMPPQGTALGGQVGVHGFGPALTKLAALFSVSPAEVEGTRGCIMVLDDDVRRLEELVRPGVTLVVRP